MGSHSLRSTVLLIPAAIIALFAVPAGGTAQERDTLSVLEDLFVVVGSRAEIEDPALLSVPVDVYGEEELARLGEVDLGEALGRLVPSFNSTRYSAGDGGALHVATLRGMNPDQVLVLVNGKRRHGVAFAKVLAGLGMGTTGTDLRAIPMHAIKRIEVLREGAASQYGSDAIAGVVNIVLKDDAAGVRATTLVGRTSRGDGQRLLTSANAGIPLGRGFANLTVEYGRQAETVRASLAPTCFGPSDGYAPCAGGGQLQQLQRYGEPDYEGGGFMLNGMLPLGESTEFYGFGGLTRRDAVSDGLYRKADWVPRNVSYVHPNGFQPLEGSELTDRSGVVGVRGPLGVWDADLSLGYGEGRFAFNALNTINPAYAAEYLFRNPGATPEAIAANAGPRETFSGAANVRQTDLNLDARRDLELGGRSSSLAVGAALRRESYWMEEGDLASYACGPSNTPGSFPAAHHLNADGSAVASCGVQGYPGYSPGSARASERSRTSVGTYADFEFNPGDNLFLSSALRLEHYTDAGSSLTGKVTGRLALGESGAALRGALSTGFRAPRLPQRGFNTIIFQGSSEGLQTTGFLPEGHAIACEDFAACSLSHETSTSVTGGFVYSADNGFLFTADAYRVSVADAIVLTEALNASHGLRPGAQFLGRNVDGVAFWTNAIDTRTHGLDVAATWRVRGGGWGAADLGATLHLNDTEITANRSPDFVRDTQTTAIADAQPGMRIGLNADVRSSGALAGRIRIQRFGEMTSPTLFEAPVTIDGATIVDVEVSLDLGAGFRASLGANNIADVLPNELPDEHPAQLWRMNYPNESAYGMMGRFVYLRLEMLGA